MCFTYYLSFWENACTMYMYIIMWCCLNKFIHSFIHSFTVFQFSETSQTSWTTWRCRPTKPSCRRRSRRPNRDQWRHLAGRRRRRRRKQQSPPRRVSFNIALCRLCACIASPIWTAEQVSDPCTLRILAYLLPIWRLNTEIRIRRRCAVRRW